MLVQSTHCPIKLGANNCVCCGGAPQDDWQPGIAGYYLKRKHFFNQKDKYHVTYYNWVQFSHFQIFLKIFTNYFVLNLNVI